MQLRTQMRRRAGSGGWSLKRGDVRVGNGKVNIPGMCGGIIGQHWGQTEICGCDAFTWICLFLSQLCSVFPPRRLAFYFFSSRTLRQGTGVPEFQFLQVGIYSPSHQLWKALESGWGPVVTGTWIRQAPLGSLLELPQPPSPSGLTAY